MNTYKPRLRYDTKRDIWWCNEYVGNTLIEAYCMWDYSERLKIQPIVVDKEVIENIFKHIEESGDE